MSIFTRKKIVAFIIVLAYLFVFPIDYIHANDATKRIYDDANLLTDSERSELEELAYDYSKKREIDIVIWTTNNPEGIDIEVLMGDFYDEMGLGYDQPHGNTALLTIDMENRDIFLAGFHKAETQLDSERIELVLDRIQPAIAKADYYDAFNQYIQISYDYMGVKPGINPEKPLLKWWMQLFIAVVIAGIIVTSMVYNSGGKITVTNRTYMDQQHTKVNQKRDVYMNKSVTRRKKPSNNNNNRGSGGGGGVTRGGTSYSGGKRSF